MVPGVQNCFQITEEGKTYNAVHSLITLTKMQNLHRKILKQNKHQFQYKITNNKTTSGLHFYVFILINKPDTFNFCKFIVTDVHCELIYTERV